MKVAAFTGGRDVPSARFRVRQYIKPLADLGIAITEMPTSTSVYPPAAHWQRPGWAATRLAEVGWQAIRSHGFDRVLLQREMLSSLATLEGLTKRPRLLDVDDAIHLLRGGRFARRIAGACDRVICGNAWLADVYSGWARDVVILPTGVDADRYHPVEKTQADRLVIGWIGTAANFPYLESLEPALKIVLARYDHVDLRIVSNARPSFPTIDSSRWSFVQWSEPREVSEIQATDIGLMPLADTDWARGKCSFKMLQYMACGKPVIVSPIGMNADVLAMDTLGIGARGIDEWVDALDLLVASHAERSRLGRAGRTVIERTFSLTMLVPKLAHHLRDV